MGRLLTETKLSNHELTTHGSTSFGYSRGPVIRGGVKPFGKVLCDNSNSWNMFGSYCNAGSAWSGISTWYVSQQAINNPSGNARVQVKDLVTDVLDDSGTWKQLPNVNAPGGDYVGESWCPYGAPSYGIRTENGGGNSVKPGGDALCPSDGSSQPLMFHGYGSVVNVNPWGIKAIYTKIQARLVKGDPNGPDNLDQAQLLVQAGADYYPEASWAGRPGLVDPSIYNGNFIKVTRDWRTAIAFVKADDVSDESIRKNPPPGVSP